MHTHTCSSAVRCAEVIVTGPCSLRKASRKPAAAVANGTASSSRFLSSYVLQSRADECDHSRGKLFRKVTARSSREVCVLVSMLARVGVVHRRIITNTNSQCRQRLSMRRLSYSGETAKHQQTKAAAAQRAGVARWIKPAGRYRAL